MGRALCRHLAAAGADWVGAVRSASPDRYREAALATAPASGAAARDTGLPPGRILTLGDFVDADWDVALAGIDTVVHLAALAHRSGTAAEADYVRANVDMTRVLVAAAVRRGVRRFVFASSVKVNGEETFGQPFRESDPPRPEDAYGRSKWAAEQVVQAAADRVESVILRLPLVYGPGVGANFLSLMRAVDRGVPLPLAVVRNARSLMFTGNLVSAIDAARRHAGAAGRTFLLSDGEDLSTPELVRRLAAGLGRTPRLYRWPTAGLRAAATMLGRRDAMRRLTGSLAVDASLFRRVTGWQAPFTVDEGIAATVAWYRRRRPV